MIESKTAQIAISQIGGMGNKEPELFDTVRGLFPAQIGLQKRVNGKRLESKENYRILGIYFFYGRMFRQGPGVIDITPIDFDPWEPIFRCPIQTPVFEGFDYDIGSYVYLNGGDWQFCYPGVIEDHAIWAFYGVELTKYNKMGWGAQQIVDPTIFAFESFNPEAVLHGVIFQVWVITPRPIVTVTKTYVSDGDTNGVFYHLATSDGAAWANPHTSGKITMSASSVNQFTVTELVSRAAEDYGTANISNSWIQADLKLPQTLILSAVSFRGRPINWDASQMVSGKIEGSNDESNWTLIQTLSGLAWTGASQWKLFIPPTQTVAYRYFRITQTAPTNSGNNYLCCSELELYGELTYQS